MDVVGFDLDGTLTTPTPRRPKPYFRQTGPERREYDEVRRRHYLDAPLLHDPRKLAAGSPWVVVSGRSIRFLPETTEWLSKLDLEPEDLRLRETPGTSSGHILHKVRACSELSVGRFYEDDPKIARALAAAGVAVVLVNSSPSQDPELGR